MKKIEAIIVEDSRLARKELNLLLKNHPEIEIVGEAENVDKALELIQEVNPSLIFLDIQMPEKDGFELLEMLDHVPTVIFTTAYDEYAIKSFEYNAFDYLLKPISSDRLAKTIERLLPHLQSLTRSTTKTLTEESKMFIKEGDKCWMVALKDIVLFDIVGNYARVYFGQHKPMVYKSLNQIEAKIPTAVFFRANRQEIININHIQEVIPWFNGKLKIVMDNGKEVELSRRQSSVFKGRLEF